jgi:hypothetical protein
MAGSGKVGLRQRVEAEPSPSLHHVPNQGERFDHYESDYVEI